MRKSGTEKILEVFERVLALLKESGKSRKLNEKIEIVKSLEEICAKVNLHMFECFELTAFEGLSSDPGSEYEVKEVTELFEEWLLFIKGVIYNRNNTKCRTDYDFCVLMDYLENVSYENILNNVKQKSQTPPADIEARVKRIKDSFESYKRFYNELMDYRSKALFVKLLKGWLECDYEAAMQPKDNAYSDCFDFDVIMCSERDVIVNRVLDCEEAVLEYADAYGKYQKMYCCDIDPEVCDILRDKLIEYSNVEVSDRSVDSIEDKISLIRMDMGYARMDALKDCERHIKEDHPKLVMCIQQNDEGIMDIPKKIRELRGNYRFALRCYKPSEIVMYAI